MENKLATTKRKRDQHRNQERNVKLFSIKYKDKIPKFMRQSEDSFKRQVHSFTYLYKIL